MKAATKTPIAVFASGRGSNFDAILAAVRAGRLDAEIRCVLSDKKDAPVLDKARAAGIPAVVVEVDRLLPAAERRAHHEAKILEALVAYQPRFLVLAGYMRVLTSRLLEAFRDPRGYVRMVNVHPSLLPAFPGVDAYRQAFEAGEKVTGVTVHLVELEVDSGPICAQESFSIDDCRSVEEVEKRGLAVEHRLFPETLRWVLAENFELDGRRLRARTS